ncbi:MAG: chemotaxis protein CheA [Defluviitaleaceae bacterium]|nr:chemotaxis protein CheA [Defluviitaleaceae bacterium]
MLEMFTFEMTLLLEQLEQNIIQGETGYTMSEINEIFRIMHTIKGSASMMLFDSISTCSHAIEDLFFYLREHNPENVDYSTLTDIVLAGMDFVRNEIAKISHGEKPDGDGSDIIATIKEFLNHLKGGSSSDTDSSSATVSDAVPVKKSSSESRVMNKFNALIRFQDGCEMENVRAYTLVHNLGDDITQVTHSPMDLVSEEAIEPIRANGFELSFSSVLTYDEIKEMLERTIYLDSLALTMASPDASAVAEQEAAEVPQDAAIAAADASSAVSSDNDPKSIDTAKMVAANPSMEDANKKSSAQKVISVNVSKLDQLLNLMGELVISEAMVTQNPELESLELESFHKEARQLRKIINEIQDNVMSMRMIPLSTTFFKMHRIVRDMCKQLSKDIKLDVIGEETEVDKNITEHIADPIMHIIRNSIDHGIEMPQDRVAKGKPEKGTVLLEAKNAGGDVLIIIKDDGKGLDRDKIMTKAKNAGLLRKPESEYTDKEINSFIFLPGFSTNAQVTSYSGRGVGMDVVNNNLEVIGGSVIVDSVPGEGTTFTLKIPLTLAIIEGMTILMGGAKYTIPIVSIKQSFKAKNEDIFTDPDGNEMIKVRGEVYNVVRLCDVFGIDNAIRDLEEGIMIMLENGDQTVCLFADELVGEQQVVVKTLSKYIGKVRGISGCTLLGNGDISLIIDVGGFFDK